MWSLLLLALVASVHGWEPDCGTSRFSDAGAEGPNTRIYGGWEAREGEWPWQVSMRSSASSAAHYCGAVILNKDFIVTACHCAVGEVASGVFLSIGDHDFGNTNGENEAVVTCSAVTEHPGYDDWTLENDIALLELTSSIVFNINVQPACPPVAGNLYVGALASLSGWGSVEGGASPDILQTTNLPIPTNADCEAAMLEVEPTWLVFDDMICAGTIPNDERDTCQGDSGGPLVSKNAAGKWEVLGLTSWGYSCAGGVPGVYTRVSWFLDWVDGIITA